MTARVDERSVEVPWLCLSLGQPKRILDVGSAEAQYLDALLLTGAEVVLLDLRPLHVVPVGAHVFTGSAGAMPNEWTEAFDLVTCVSTLDHIGLAAYGHDPDPGALKASIHEMWRVLVSGGALLLTIPFGRDQVIIFPSGEARIFGIEALNTLFPQGVWTLRVLHCWRLDRATEQYVSVDPLACSACGYDLTRAEAVIALKLEKVG